MQRRQLFASSKYKNAINSEDARNWRDAMDEQMVALDANDTYVLEKKTRTRRSSVEDGSTH